MLCCVVLCCDVQALSEAERRIRELEEMLDRNREDLKKKEQITAAATEAEREKDRRLRETEERARLLEQELRTLQVGPCVGGWCDHTVEYALGCSSRSCRRCRWVCV